MDINKNLPIDSNVEVSPSSKLDDSQINLDSSTVASLLASLQTRTYPVESPVKTVSNSHFRGSDPPHWVKHLYLEPLMDGWRREIVQRQRSSRRTFDVYYFTPDGVKLRSRPEVAEYLRERQITKYSATFNFTFNNRAMGGEFAPYETIRLSKPHVGRPGKSPSVDVGADSDNLSPIPVKRPRAANKIKMKNYVDDPTFQEPLYCICSDVEKGEMILCDNAVCNIGWYHFACVNIEQGPSGAWYCPICRGSDSSTLNPAFLPDKMQQTS